MESASPTPTLASKRSEPTPLSATVRRVRSRVARLENGGERRDTSKLAKQRVDVLASHPAPALESAYSQFPAILPLAGPNTSPAYYALTPGRQGELDRLVRIDVEGIAAKQAEVEAKRVADRLERVEKEKIEKELKAATAAKLREHRCPQQAERVEYQVLRVGQECGQSCLTDDEVREILKKDQRASGTVYGTHYTIRFHHKQMFPYAVATRR